MTEQQEPYTLFGNAGVMARGMDGSRTVARVVATVYNTLKESVDNEEHALVLCLKWMEVWPEWSRMPAPEPEPKGEA